MGLFNHERPKLCLALAGLCALLVVGCLGIAAGMGLGLLPASSVLLVALVLTIGLLLIAGLLLLLEGFAERPTAAPPTWGLLSSASVSPRGGTVVPFRNRPSRIPVAPR